MRKLLFPLLLLFSIATLAADKVVTLQVKGLSCPICAGALEKQIRKISGVKDVKIHLSQGKATVVTDETVDGDQIREAIIEAGFTPGDIEKVEKVSP